MKKKMLVRVFAILYMSLFFAGFSSCNTGSSSASETGDKDSSFASKTEDRDSSSASETGDRDSSSASKSDDSSSEDSGLSELPASEGLAYTLINNDTEYEVALGTCTDTQIVIPSKYQGKSVVKIGKDAFSHKNTLSSFILPESIKEIGENAFERCFLTEIIIPNSVMTIGRAAFAYCSRLEKVVLSSNLTSIADNMFTECYELNTLSLPSGIKSVGKDAFTNCIKITELILPEGLESIDDYAFSQMIGFRKELVIPDSVKTIGAGAFIYGQMTKLTIGNSVETIKSGAFWNCEDITSVVFRNATGWKAGTLDIDVSDSIRNAAYLTNDYGQRSWTRS